ncbi:uncharacterized protein LOC134481925 isoform X2 [Rattus norvegicus]|uniref:uncharacterized protein LOC134481925 isoform X2 n=1 Tax=Rattus norvegicus TaxID=10116 RepID=UPI002FD84F02
MFHQLLKLVQKERGDQGETRPRQKKAGLLSWFIRKASSENFISNHEKRIKKLEELKLEIQKCKIERDELSRILDLFVNDGLNYSIRNFHLLNECNELKKNVRILMNENRKLLVEQTELQASCEEGKRFCEEASKTIYTADIESLCPVTFE